MATKLAINPDPKHVTPELWGLWLAIKAAEPKARLGGIYAPKTGYHDTRAQNPKGNYSVVSALDRKGPSDKAAALDITFTDAQKGNYATISKYAARLLRSGRDLSDERGNYLREFYGQADADAAVEGWDFQKVCPVTSDATHRWHIHLSILRAYLNNPKAMRAILSIWLGEPVKVWRSKEAALLLKPKIPAQRKPTTSTPPPPKLAPAKLPTTTPEGTAPTAVVIAPVTPAPVTPPPATEPAAGEPALTNASWLDGFMAAVRKVVEIWLPRRPKE